MRKTIRKVMIVVLVLITSCHVSLKWKRGPVIAQTRMIPRATIKVAGLPAVCDAHFAARVNHDKFRLLMYNFLCQEERFSYPPASTSIGWLAFQLRYLTRSRSISMRQAAITDASSMAPTNGSTSGMMSNGLN